MISGSLFQASVSPSLLASADIFLGIFNMPHEDISFSTSDNVTLRGWFYKPQGNSSGKHPCLIMAHGFSALKEMDLNTFAEHFTAKLAVTCLVYDNRGFGDSDTKEGQPRHEIIPAQQTSDYSDAITYAQSRSEVDPSKIGIWGSSYSGGHVLWVGAVDKRVKAVLCQVPCVDGWTNFHRLIRPDFVGGLNQLFQDGMSSGTSLPQCCLLMLDPFQIV